MRPPNVILSPFACHPEPFAVTLSEAKGLFQFLLRVNFAKDPFQFPLRVSSAKPALSEAEGNPGSVTLRTHRKWRPPTGGYAPPAPTPL